MSGKYTTAQRIRQYLNEHDLRQVDILRAAEPYCVKYGIKLNKNDLSQYVSGKVVPGNDKLKILALAMQVSELWLMGFDDELQQYRNIIPVPEMVLIPLLGTIACGEPILAEENIEGYVKSPSYAEATYALTCKGDSMIDARILEGDIVLIRQQPDVEN